MKSIAIFVKNLQSGGAEKQSVLLAKALANNYNVHYIIFNGEKIHQKYMDMLKEEPHIQIKSFRGNHYHRYKNFVAYLKQEKITIIFSYLTAANTYACLAGKQTGIKVFTGIRNTQLPFLKYLADCLLTNWFAEKAISNSYAAKEIFINKGFKRDKVIVIPNCFENITPYRAKPDRSSLHIITVGRFVPQKDYLTAIRAISELKKIKANIWFDIIGYGELEGQIRNWIKEYGIADITTIYINPDNIPELLEQADIYISTSLFEGTSNSIMEAMNANLPIVATDVGDNKYLIQHGTNGYLCKQKDCTNIAQYLKILLYNKELRIKQGRESKEILLNKYSIDILIQKYDKLLNE